MRTRRRDRAGLSLVEMLVTISVGAILLTLGVGLIHGLMRLNHANRARVSDDARLDRLGRLFRDDAHAATAVAHAAPERLALTLPGGHAVEYRADKHAIVRIRQGEGDGALEERFKLPERGEARLSTREGGPGTVVGLTVARRQGRLPSSGLRAEGVLGLDHRFSDERGR